MPDGIEYVFRDGLNTQRLFPAWLEQELRSDHAGETGAMWIYRGILAVSRDPAVYEFAERHLKTETRHLKEIETLLPPKRRSRLLGLWRVAGFVTGALPALFGQRGVFYTIEAVETFVDHHYQQQIDKLQPIEDLTRDLATVRAVLIDCQADEIAHRDEAAANVTNEPGVIIRAWCYLVGVGSRSAVAVARHF